MLKLRTNYMTNLNRLKTTKRGGKFFIQRVEPIRSYLGGNEMILKAKYRKAVAIVMAIFMALTIYSSIGTIPVHAAEGSQTVKTRVETTVVEKSVDNEITIKNVEVLTRGDIQSLYRDTVYKGNVANDEDADKWYTTYREFNLKDPRIFNLEFKVPATDVGDDANAYLGSLSLNYGGYPIGDWGDGKDLRGENDILELQNKTITDNGDETYTVKMALKTSAAWAPVNSGINIPYEGYYAGRQFDFSSGQSADNRAWWQAGPANKGLGTYELAAMKGTTPVAATNVHIGLYDEMYSWIEMNEYAQSIIKAITGSEIPIAEFSNKPIGSMAKGYIKVDENGNFAKGDRANSVYVEVSILGYGLTDNSKPENVGFNNYARFNPQWNIVVAYDEDTVNTYLNETVPTMNENPQALIDKYKDMDAEDIDMINVYYQNNTHADEVSGTDSSIKNITDLIDGGKAGKKIPYKTMTEDEMDLRYRVPTEGYNTGTSHTVKGTYEAGGIFMSDDTRTDAVFDTKEALEEIIFVTTLCSNPDGKAGMRRVNRYALDMNRDVVFSTQPETISLVEDICKWDPLILNEWHGYVGGMLIEPCTAPHDPAYEYDLLQNNMIQLSYEAGMAVAGSTGYSDFLVPWDHYEGGDWDDGGTIYAPMFAMLLGTYGYTVEFPHANSDSFEAGNVINYAMVNAVLSSPTKFYEGNALNGALMDVDGETRDSHAVDNKYTSLRKSSVMNKLEHKLRGVENIDSMAADKYFIDLRDGKEVVVGRPRPVDSAGKTLPFFPDYLVVPTDSENQYNIAEGIKGVNHMINLGVKVSVATEDVTYNGTTIPKGAYVLDMKQGRRNLITEIMGKGYDATNFASMYADIYCNFPDVRGFDSIQIYGDGLYDGKLKDLNGKIEKEANIAGDLDEYVVFKSQSTDAVRFVNLLLSGRSSGPSYSAKGDVWMLRKDVEGVGNASDYLIATKDLNKINNLVDNHDLGLMGCHIEGKYISELPKEAVQLVEPKIQLNTERTAQSGGVLWWALDDYLGFGSMVDYNGSKSTIRPDANVVISNNVNPTADIINAVKKDKLGLIVIQNPGAISDANFGVAATSAGSFKDIAVNGQYNVNDSLFTANYQSTTTLYGRGNYYNAPAGAKILFKSATDGNDAFIGGWQSTGGSKEVFGNRTMIFSTILNGGGITGKPIQALVFGQQMHNRSHYQKLLPMLATGIYAGAAGILDDFNDPIINDMQKTGTKVVASASEPNSGVVESGIEKITLYQWNGTKYIQVADKVGDSIEFTAKDTKSMKFKVVAADYAGNEVEKTFDLSETGGITPNPDPSPITPVVIQKPEVVVDGNVGGKTLLSVYGTTLSITPDEGYEVGSVTLNGTDLGKVAEVKNLKTGDKVVVKFVKKSATGDKDLIDQIKNLKIKATSKLTTLNGKKAVRISWTAGLDLDGYEVYRSTERFSGFGTKPYFKTSKNNYTNNKGLEAGETYFYKIRGYKVVDGVKVFTPWSTKAWRTI